MEKLLKKVIMLKEHTNTIKPYIFSHKKIGALILIVVILVGYWIYNKTTNTDGEIRYITAKVEKGQIVTSVSGSGQVSSVNQIDIKAKASGDVAYIAAKDGQKVSAGQMIAQLDTKDAQKIVRDAEVNVESAQITLAKLKIEKSDENMNANLIQAYDDGFNTVSSVFLDLPTIITNLKDMFFKSNPLTAQWNVDWYEGQAGNENIEKTRLLKKNFIDSYYKAKNSYENNFNTYKTISRNSDGIIIENLISQTYDTTKIIADSIKNANNYVDFVKSEIQANNLDSPSLMATHKTSLNTYTRDTNTHLGNLLSIKTDIKTYKDAFLNSDLDIQSANLTLKQKQNALQDAKDKLADYFIRAPFAGSITKINIKKADSVTSGTVVTTLITKQQLAEISLNEVDVARVKIGQKATLTFDAIPDLTLSGLVVDIDTIGEVDQGVVTYIVKINFDTQDDRIKTAMSVSADIITDMKENILIVPNSAVKSQKGKNYIEMFNFSLLEEENDLLGSISKVLPEKIPVEIGLTNNTQSEITSGVTEGQEIIIRTISPTTTKTKAPNLFGGSTPATRNPSSSGTKAQAR